MSGNGVVAWWDKDMGKWRFDHTFNGGPTISIAEPTIEAFTEKLKEEFAPFSGMLPVVGFTLATGPVDF